MVLGLVPGMSLTAFADQSPITYLNASGETATCESYNEVTKSNKTLTSGWNVVTESVTIENSQKVDDGALNIILCDGATLTIDVSSFAVSSKGYFTIYAQSTGNNMGELVASSSDNNALQALSGLTINGGKISVNSKYSGIYASGSLTINGGKISVNSNSSSGIFVANGSLTINGGIVTASGSTSAISGNVANSIPGIGWTNTEGTEGETVIDASNVAKSIDSYKRVMFRAVELYPLYVGGTQVTSGNASNIDGNSTASYDATTKTLTLNGFTHYDETYGIYNDGIDGLTVIIENTNTIENGYGGIYSSGSLNIKGSGTLNIKSTDASAIDSANDLTISESVNITVEGDFAGISANKLTLESTGEINVKGSTWGLFINGEIKITNGDVTAEGGASGIGEKGDGAPLVIGTNAKLIAIGGRSYGAIYNGGSDSDCRKVQNAIAGVAWTNKEGTEGRQNIAVSAEGQPISCMYRKVEFPVSHNHSFTYSASGATITATCSEDDCSLTDNKATLTIAKPALTTYGGTGDAAATLTGLTDFNTATNRNVAVGDIKYVGREGTTYSESATAPTDAGKYTAKITVAGETASVNYEITKASETAPNSDTTQLNINYTAETISAKDGYEVAGDGNGTSISSFSDILDSDTPTVFIRKTATDNNHDPSAWVAVTLTPRPAAPTGLGSTNATNGSTADGMITNAETTMEYSADGTNWTVVTSATITGLNPGTYSVRVKATDLAPHGVETEVTVGSNYVALTEANKPTISVSDSHNPPVVGDTLTASTTATDIVYEWYRDEVKISSATANTYILTADDVGKAITVKVKQTKQADGTDYNNGFEPTQTSDATAAVAKKSSPAAPADATTTGFTPNYPAETFTVGEGYEVSSTNGDTVTAISSLTDVIDGTGKIYIRVKETADTKAGAWLEVTLSSRPDAPAAPTTENATNGGTADGKIKNALATWEYKNKDTSKEPTDWTAITTAGDVSVKPGTYEIRVKATTTAPHGKATDVTVGSNYTALDSNTTPTISVTRGETAVTSGAPQVDDVLTASTTASDIAYEWYRGDAKIEGEENNTYTLTADDVGKSITVKVYQTKNANGDELTGESRPTLTSEATAAVEKKTSTATQIAATGITVTNTDTGITFTAPAQENIGTAEAPVDKYDYGYKTGDATDYTWTSTLPITGLTPDTTYTVVVREKETATTAAGLISEPVTVKTYVTVTINGTPTQGKEVSVNLTPAKENVTYKWYVGDNTTADGDGTKIVPNAGSDKLKVEVYDGETLIGTATTTANIKTLADVISESTESPVTITLDGPVSGDISIPTDKKVLLDLKGQEMDGGISVSEGSTLTITDSSNPQTGTVKGTVSANTGNVIIKGGRYNNTPAATDPGTLTIHGGLFKNDPTSLLSVPYEVKQSGVTGYSNEVYSTYTALTAENKPSISVTTKAAGNTGTNPQIGDTLTASTTAKPVSYQWYRDGVAIEGATGSTYTLTLDDRDKVITVKATQAANADGVGNPATEQTQTSEATATVERKTNTATQITAAGITVTKTDTGITFTAPAQVNTGTEDAPVYKYEYGYKTGDATDYTWQDAPAISSLTHFTEYEVVVREKKTADTAAGPISEPVTVKTNLTVTITPPVAEGVKTTVTLDPTPEGTVTYQWFRDNDLTNAISTEKDYVPTTADVGKKLTLKVYDTDGNEIGVAVFGDEESETVKSFNDYLNEQLDADPVPTVIKLDGSVSGPVTIPADKEITLDLNGQTITGGVVATGKVVIKDSSDPSTGTITGGVTVNDGGEVTIESGTVNGGVTVKNGGKAGVTGGTINGNLSIEEDGTLTVTGGTFGDPDVLDYIDKDDENADVTIKLTANETLTTSPVTVDAKGKVTIDLNGHMLTGSVDVDENAELEIIDSATDGKLVGDLVNDGVLSVTSGTVQGTITNNSTLTLGDAKGTNLPTITGNVTNDGTMTVLNGTYSGTIENNDDCTITGGTFNGGVTNNGSMKLSGGTVNGSGTVTNEEKGTLTVDGGEINVNIVNKGTATIESGTFASGKSVTTTTEKGKTTINGGTFKGNVTSTESGKTTIKGGQFDNKPTASTSGSVSIEGGKFKADPTENNEGVTAASGKQIYYVDGKDYPYQVIDKPNTGAAEVKVDQGETVATVADTIAEEDQAAAQNTAVSTTADLEEAAVEHVKQIVASSTRVNDDTKNIVIVPALEVKAEEYTVSGEDTTLTLDIEAVYTSYETDGSITTAAQIESNTDESKVKEIGSGKMDTIGKAVEVKIEVPAAFAQALGASTSNTSGSAVTVYVKHTHDSKNYEYQAKLYYADSKYFVEFTNPNGFSTFTISKTSSSVVEANVHGENRYYADLETALNDIPNGTTLTLTKDDMADEDLTAVINSAKEITIAKGATNNDLSNLKITAGSGLNITKTDNGDNTVTFKTTKRSSGGSVVTYTPSASETKNGVVTTDPKTAKAGEAVVITATPDKGYKLGELTVKDAGGNEIELTKNEDGTYTFVQPNGKVTIEAKFIAKFVDVVEGSYYEEAVDWAVENGITNGVDDTHFAPDATCTRAQAVTFLWRALGCPEPTSTKSEFTDVTDADAFYFKAVLWATENGVTLGYDDGRFGVDDVVTRAHMVTFMERAMKGKATTAESFTDVPEGAYYADAAAWAKENGVSDGIGDNKFGGETDCLRAQIVTMLYRYFVK